MDSPRDNYGTQESDSEYSITVTVHPNNTENVYTTDTSTSQNSEIIFNENPLYAYAHRSDYPNNHTHSYVGNTVREVNHHPAGSVVTDNGNENLETVENETVVFQHSNIEVNVEKGNEVVQVNTVSEDGENIKKETEIGNIQDNSVMNDKSEEPTENSHQITIGNNIQDNSVVNDKSEELTENSHQNTIGKEVDHGKREVSAGREDDTNL